LRNRILLGHADLLSAPRFITLSGREACMKIQDITTVVTGVQTALQPASINYSAENVGVGPTVDIVPTQEDDGKWRLRVRASVTAFLGYDNPKASISNPGGKPIGYEIPHPHFRAVEADAEDSLLSGQTLALRGPLWTETTKTKGHFLVPAKTKTVRQRLYIFVTPASISPTGMIKS
jgi:type II secretory pathway component GspD/PulD (secretin)